MKYFWSAFFVMGVLSISIGTSTKLDPLIIRALSLQDRTSKLINPAPKADPTLTVFHAGGLLTLNLTDNENKTHFDTLSAYADLLEKDKKNPGKPSAFEWHAADPKNLTLVREGVRTTVPLTDLGEAGTKEFPKLKKKLEESLRLGALGTVEAVLKVEGIASLTGASAPKTTVPLNDPAYIAIRNDFLVLKKDLESASDRVSVHSSEDPRSLSVLEAADIYYQIQTEFYANYLRNAHAEDEAVVGERETKISKLESERANDFGGFLKRAALTFIPTGGLFAAYDPYDKELKQASLIDRKHGAVRYSPSGLDDMNLKLNAKTALPLYKDANLSRWDGRKIAKPFNTRHVADANGANQRIEIFMNFEEKRLIEYSVLSSPKTKHAYLKLLQMVAIRERMVNRWTLRRMLDLPIRPDKDRAVNACGADLVAYQLDKPKPVNLMRNFTSLGALDRFNDFTAIIPKLEPALLGHPLLTDDQYTDLILYYLSGFTEYGGLVIQNFGGDYGKVHDYVLKNYVAIFRQKEDDDLKPLTRDFLIQYNLPADDISTSAVGERMASRAFEFRRGLLADRLIQLVVDKMKFTSVKPAAMVALADQRVDEFLKDVEPKWRSAQKTALVDALIKAQNVDWLLGLAKIRYRQFEDKTLTIAAPGARAVKIQGEVEGITKALKKKPWYSGDRTKAEYYMRDYSSRIAFSRTRLGDRLVPVTPEQLSQFFFKKIQALKDGGPEAEAKTAAEVLDNATVMHFMQNYFGEIGALYQKAVEANMNPNAPAKDLKGTCGKACGSVVVKEQARRLTDEGKTSLQSVEITEDNTPLASFLIPTATKVIADFESAIARLPAVSAPDAVERRVVAATGKIDAFNPHLSRTHGAAVSESTGIGAAGLRRQIAYYTAQKAAKDNYYIANEGDRKKARNLLNQALAVLGLAQVAAGADWAPGFRHVVQHYNTGTIGSVGGQVDDYWELRDLISTERIVDMQMGPAPKAGGLALLERVVGTLFDQEILANIIENEVYGRAPVLALQNTSEASADKAPQGIWTRLTQGSSSTPSLLRLMAPLFNKNGKVDHGWNLPAARSVFYRHLYRAGMNDVGKVEDFCEADLRDYEHDEKFKRMFKSIDGLRANFGSRGDSKKWDDEVSKVIRTRPQAFIEDFIDPISMPIMIAFGILFAWEIGSAIVVALLAGGTSTLAGIGALIGSVFGTAGRFLALQLTGNLAPVQILFTIQSILMASVYCYQLPPELDYQFQIANSQIVTEQVSLVDREKLQKTREEVVSSRFWARFGIIAEIGQGVGFTAPGVLRTLGFKGASFAKDLTEGVSVAARDRVVAESLPQLVKEHGFNKGVALYTQRIVKAALKGDRAPVVKELATDRDLAHVMSERMAPLMGSKKAVLHFYSEMIQASETEIATTAKTVKELSDQMKAIKKSSQWSDFRAYLKNLDLKYGKDEKYFRLIVDADYRPSPVKFIVGVHGETELVEPVVKFAEANVKNSREIEIGVAFARMRDQEYRLEYLKNTQKRIQAIETTKVGVDETREVLSGLSLSDWQMHEKILLRVTKANAEDAKVDVKAVKKIFKGFNYLTEDYKKLNHRMVTVSQGIRSGIADLRINKNGVVKELDPEEIKAHPERFEYLTIDLDDL